MENHYQLFLQIIVFTWRKKKDMVVRRKPRFVCKLVFLFLFKLMTFVDERPLHTPFCQYFLQIFCNENTRNYRILKKKLKNCYSCIINLFLYSLKQINKP
ncbi:hypothetical protein D3C86_1404770 [compost metagenome]